MPWRLLFRNVFGHPVRALLITFATLNPLQFNRPDGKGYPHGLSGAALTAIHWAHRLGATMVLLLAGGFGLRLLARAETRIHGQWLLAALLLQLGLGIANILLQLPLPLAVAHNTGAALLLVTTLAATVRVFQRSEARHRYTMGGFTRQFQTVR